MGTLYNHCGDLYPLHSCANVLSHSLESKYNYLKLNWYLTLIYIYFFANSHFWKTNPSRNHVWVYFHYKGPCDCTVCYRKMPKVTKEWLLNITYILRTLESKSLRIIIQKYALTRKMCIKEQYNCSFSCIHNHHISETLSKQSSCFIFWPISDESASTAIVSSV